MLQSLRNAAVFLFKPAHFGARRTLAGVALVSTIVLFTLTTLMTSYASLWALGLPYMLQQNFVPGIMIGYAAGAASMLVSNLAWKSLLHYLNRPPVKPLALDHS